MNKLIKSARRFLTVGVLLILIGVTQMVHAESYSAFTAKAIIPDNQVDRSLTYFDLRLHPGDKQTVQVLVRNSGSETITAFLDINPATTGRNGVIVYSNQENTDENLTISIDSVATLAETEVSVPAGGERLVDINLEMPREQFDGCLLGGIQVSAEPENGKAAVATENTVNIENKYVYTVGLKLTQNNSVVTPEMHLNSVGAVLTNYRPGVAANLLNSEAYIIKGMTVSAQVYRENETAPMHTVELDNVNVAPQSNFDAIIDWNGQKLEAGTYRLTAQATYEDRTWEWDELFTVAGTTADTINSESVTEARAPIWPYVLLSAIIVALVAVIIWLISRRRKRDA